MKLYIIRHGETDYNLLHKHDHEDKARLTEHGIMRAQKIVELFDEVPIDAIYSSPFTRCLDTISPLAEDKNLEIRQDTRLREFYIGPMQDNSWEKVSSEYNKLLHDINAEKQEDCEHMSEVTLRVKDFIEYLKNNHKEDEALVISTHSGVILYLLSIIDSVPAKNGLEFLPSNQGVTHEDAYIFREI